MNDTRFNNFLSDGNFKTILADPPWRYNNRTGKASPEHKRLNRYDTMSMDELIEMRSFIDSISASECHLWLWCTWPMIKQGLEVIEAWGFQYKTGIPWIKIAKNGDPDGRSMGFYGRVVTEILLFGVRSDGIFRTKPPHNKKNIIIAPKRDHSRKPHEQYELIESQSYEPYIELFARDNRIGWTSWGAQAEKIIKTA